MTIIEEDPVQEGLGTDFKKKKSDFSEIKKSILSNISGAPIV